MEFSIATSTEGLPEFLAYLAMSIALVLVYVVVYSAVTPHNEFGLIRQNKSAAMVAFTGSLLGFVVPLSSAVSNSTSLGDCAVWGVVALAVQILAYFLLHLPIDNLSGRIAEGQIASRWLARRRFACRRARQRRLHDVLVQKITGAASL